MTLRKTLFLAIKEALKAKTCIEYIDFDRGQLEGENWTAALIKISRIDWQPMTNRLREGECAIDVTLHCKDGWIDQNQYTDDPEGGLMEIDLIDSIVEAVELVQGDCFKPIYQTSEDTEEADQTGKMKHVLSFRTTVFKTVNTKYIKKQINITQL